MRAGSVRGARAAACGRGHQPPAAARQAAGRATRAGQHRDAARPSPRAAAGGCPAAPEPSRPPRSGPRLPSRHAHPRHRRRRLCRLDLRRALVEAGHEVVVLDNVATGHAAATSPARRFVGAATATGRSWRSCSRDAAIDAVLHCAARSLVGESIREPALYFGENVAGGLALLDAMRDAGVSRLVFSSTAAVYGEPERPRSARTRRSARSTRTARRSARSRRRAGWYAGVRPARSRRCATSTSPARPRATARSTTRRRTSSRTSCAAAEGGPPLTLFGDDYPTPDGTPIRDYIHVARPRRGPPARARGDRPGDARRTEPLICNLGSGDGLQRPRGPRGRERVVGRPVPRTVGPRRAGDPPSSSPRSIVRARSSAGTRAVDARGDDRLGLGGRQARSATRRDAQQLAPASSCGSSGAVDRRERAPAARWMSTSPEPVPVVAHRPQEPRARRAS